jgi:hypothetical protein
MREDCPIPSDSGADLVLGLRELGRDPALQPAFAFGQHSGGGDTARSRLARSTRRYSSSMPMVKLGSPMIIQWNSAL